MAGLKKRSTSDSLLLSRQSMLDEIARELDELGLHQLGHRDCRSAG